ncbi:hypothetical protein [Devosia sp. FJ2-5-3]|uniref:hypothetical protein n=1 Tax=Devosia sp. FJ2-5-3 TaxID=2976680 RepID=UPI0023D816C1|nr:hypothetical protein [Devosia sp. FJ2-5-3]WEJ60224.1 hypothetical protein N0P34_09380 [Devosia sp. FJ2-5-3]
MAVKMTARVTNVSEFKAIAKVLASPAMKRAAATGLTEHAEEQRRQSLARVSDFTGVPRSRMARATTVKRAIPGHNMMAVVQTADKAVGLEEYGSPNWVRDLNPFAEGRRGGAVSSMPGVEASAWGRRRIHKGTFFAKGTVWVRRGKDSKSLRKIYSVVLANELSKPGWRNELAAGAYLKLDLERRVLRHVLRVVT